MQNDTRTLPVTFNNSGATREAALDRLVTGMTDFLDHYCHPSLVKPSFLSLVGDGNGTDRFERLLSATGFGGDPYEFFKATISALVATDGSAPISLNGVGIPHLALMVILEVILPGSRFFSIKTVAELEKQTGVRVPEKDRDDMQTVLDTYPVRLSMHTIRQMRISRNVAYQYLPFTEELDTVGNTNTWIGQFHQGLLEQMYANRVIFLLNMSCPVYCRFCFRKHKESRNETNPTKNDVLKAVDHIRNSPNVKEIVLTGGDPFMNRRNMDCAVDNLATIDHVRTLRLATRSIAYFPHLFLDANGQYLAWLKEKNMALQQKGKRLEVATHFIHPDEVSPQSLAIITDLVRNGIPVYIQTPYLKDCNDKGPELVRLFGLLRGAGAEMHYIYIPCSPIHGNSIYWSPLSSGITVASHLRAHLSDRAIPRICTATPIGKMDWHTSGWAVEPVAGDDNLIWIRTPYTPDYFKSFAPLTSKLDNIRVNAEGTIDIQYFAKIGDENLFLGSMPPDATFTETDESKTPATRDMIHADACLTDTIVATNIAGLFRQHETRVEITTTAKNAAINYIRADTRITDVIIAAENDVVLSLGAVEKLVPRLAAIPHVNAVRLRSLAFSHSPEVFTRAVIDRLADLNRLSIVGPLRLEIETRFYRAEDITANHDRLVRNVNNRGITVYANTPLLAGINNNAQAVQALSFRLRQSGIEFHHLYVAGLPQQAKHNKNHPVQMRDIIDIATRVRREGSGREIPRYILRTALGEVDFGLTSVCHIAGGEVWARLTPYDQNYFKNMDSGFEWPEGIRVDKDGTPSVKVTGLTGTGLFSLA